jgi:hypothetical protein
VFARVENAFAPRELELAINAIVDELEFE